MCDEVYCFVIIFYWFKCFKVMVEFVFDGVLGLGEIWCKVFVFYFGLVWLLCKVIVDDIVEVLGFGLKFVGEVVVVLF